MSPVGLSPMPVVEARVDKQGLAVVKNFFVARKLALGISAALLIATMALYYPVIHHPFANLDDMGYVYENLHVQEGLTWPTIKWAIRTFDDNNWHPVTWISHSIDCQMFG